MRNIRYVYESDDSFVSRAIRWFTRGRVSHVGMLYSSADWEGDWIAEALPKGTMCRPVRSRKWAYIVTPKYNAVPHLQATQEFVDRKYDFKGFFLFAVLILAWRWLRLKLRKPTLSGKDQICSEWAAHTLLPVLGPVIDDPQWVHPEELLKLQEQFPDFFEVQKVL